MKKSICLLIILSMILTLLSGCGDTGKSPEATQASHASQEGKIFPTTTLMVYMVGSDLEPKSGAASSDLQEIANSGIDRSYNHVVVCAGGSPYWHTEGVAVECINILSLGAGGFTVEQTYDSASMGTAEQLASFLEYCEGNYPADEFALILWDHGNGPVMGYGKDLLYENDALLLTEMAQALATSPFGAERKLAWIGFDACLMASAELSCLLADYAHYLVSSQEVEPAFGWDYSFLSQLGKVPTVQLLETLTQNYLAACEAYYTERNYDHYDVTLSVVDLSYAGELQTSINNLFSKAAAEVSHYYDLLAMSRVQSRALGRATTGSEYDLVDLEDMALRLSAQYPKETQDLLSVIEKMVSVNATSTEGCCGMSLYYPFYNKYYYEEDWGEVYGNLNIFPEYQTYLESYEETWLKEDKLESVPLGMTPEETGENTYSVTLNPEQAEAFGSATYHILERVSGDVYRKLYTGQDVIWESPTLTAEYEGMTIYVKTDTGTKFIPPLSAVDSIGNLHRYSGIFGFSNMTYKPEGLTDEELPEILSENWRYLLTMNKETNSIEISGTIPQADTTAKELLVSGRIAEVDTSLYGAVNFYHNEPRYITRYENGVIQPISQWYGTGVGSYHTIALAEGYSFEYAPLEGGEYYLMFEITDTQSVTYCTDLLPITVEDVPEEKTEYPLTQSAWREGQERVLLKEQDDIKVYLTVMDTESNGTRIFVEAENFTEFNADISIGQIIVNGKILCDTGCYFTTKSYDFMYTDLSLGILEGILNSDDLTSLEFTIKITNERTGALIWPYERLQVDMTAAPRADPHEEYVNCLDYDTPYRGAFAREQVFYETEELRLTLIGLGESSQSIYYKNALWIYGENLSQKDLNVGIYGLVVNGHFISTSDSATLPAGLGSYFRVSISNDTWESLGLGEIQSLEILAAASEGQLWWLNKTACLWCPIALEEAGTAGAPLTGTLLWEEEGVSVSLYKSDPETRHWYILVENHRNQDISLDAVDLTYRGATVRGLRTIVLSDEKLGAGQRTVSEIFISEFDTDDPLPEEVSFRFQIRSFDETQVLFTASEPVVLSTR